MGSYTLHGDRSEVREELAFSGYMNNATDVFLCPTPDCHGSMVLNDTSRCERLQCEVCHQVYGSRCRLLYHFKAENCEEVKSLTRRYTHWKMEQRLPFMQHLAQQRDDAATQLVSYERQNRINSRELFQYLVTLRLNVITDAIGIIYGHTHTHTHTHTHIYIYIYIYIYKWVPIYLYYIKTF